MEWEKEMTARNCADTFCALNEARVAIAGLGGLGSNVAVYLTRAGIGELLLVDFDIVEISNLNRQNYYVEHIGQAKTTALESQLKKINPNVKIITKKLKITNENAIETFKEYGIVCEAFDGAEDKAMLIDSLLSSLPNIKIVSGSGMSGIESANNIITKRVFKNLYVCGDMQSSFEVGIMSPRVSICAAHQANMIIRLLLNMEEA